jgi:hypothetical protein
MKVKDLIKQLGKLDGEKEVLIGEESCNLSPQSIKYVESYFHTVPDIVMNEYYLLGTDKRAIDTPGYKEKIVWKDELV